MTKNRGFFKSEHKKKSLMKGSLRDYLANFLARRDLLRSALFL